MQVVLIWGAFSLLTFHVAVGESQGHRPHLVSVFSQAERLLQDSNLDADAFVPGLALRLRPKPAAATESNVDSNGAKPGRIQKEPPLNAPSQQLRTCIETIIKMFDDPPYQVRVRVTGLRDTEAEQLRLEGYFVPRRPDINFQTREELGELEQLEGKLKVARRKYFDAVRVPPRKPGKARPNPNRVVVQQYKNDVDKLERERDAIVARNRQAKEARQESYERVLVRAVVTSELAYLLDQPKIINRSVMLLVTPSWIEPAGPDDSIGRPPRISVLHAELADVPNSLKLSASDEEIPQSDDDKDELATGEQLEQASDPVP